MHSGTGKYFTIICVFVRACVRVCVIIVSIVEVEIWYFVPKIEHYYKTYSRKIDLSQCYEMLLNIA